MWPCRARAGVRERESESWVCECEKLNLTREGMRMLLFFPPKANGFKSCLVYIQYSICHILPNLQASVITKLALLFLCFNHCQYITLEKVLNSNDCEKFIVIHYASNIKYGEKNGTTQKAYYCFFLLLALYFSRVNKMFVNVNYSFSQFLFLFADCVSR